RQKQALALRVRCPPLPDSANRLEVALHAPLADLRVEGVHAVDLLRVDDLAVVNVGDERANDAAPLRAVRDVGQPPGRVYRNIPDAAELLDQVFGLRQLPLEPPGLRAPEVGVVDLGAGPLDRLRDLGRLRRQRRANERLDAFRPQPTRVQLRRLRVDPDPLRRLDGVLAGHQGFVQLL